MSEMELSAWPKLFSSASTTSSEPASFSERRRCRAEVVELGIGVMMTFG